MRLATNGALTVWWLQIFSNLGNWFSYVSTLLVVDKLGGGRSILLSVVLISRFLPSIFLFPISGVFADRFDRVTILVVSNLIASGAVVLLPVVKTPNLLGYVFSCSPEHATLHSSNVASKPVSFPTESARYLQLVTVS